MKEQIRQFLNRVYDWLDVWKIKTEEVNNFRGVKNYLTIDTIKKALRNMKDGRGYSYRFNLPIQLTPEYIQECTVYFCFSNKVLIGFIIQKYQEINDRWGVFTCGIEKELLVTNEIDFEMLDDIFYDLIDMTKEEAFEEMQFRLDILQPHMKENLQGYRERTKQILRYVRTSEINL